MTEITKETLFSSNTQSENEQLTLLKQHFPNCFDKNGAFLPEKMAEALQSNGIKTEKESYSLNWLGKSYAKVLKIHHLKLCWQKMWRTISSLKTKTAKTY